MNKLKGFYIQNKQLVMLTASVVIGVFIIFAIIAVIINKNGTDNQENKTTALKAEVTKDRQDSSSDITTINDDNNNGDDDETETAALQDETTNEKETPRETVNPKTLPYKIMVNRAANCITVYENDGNGNFVNPIKAIVCSTGKYVGNTPLGNFSTLISYKWLRMVDNSYGQYAYRFYGSILFHSVPYYTQDKGNLEWEQFNLLGEAASLGCVRMCVADAIWLINNCQVGTAVEVYDDADNPGPLGKPEMIKIPEDSPYRGWDPTDPDKNNPWNECSPKITTDKTSATIYTHSSDDLKKIFGIKGYDTCGNDVTDMIKISGLDVHRAGVYTVKLTLTDLIGRKADDVKIIVEVKDKEVPTESSTAKESDETETTTDPSEGDESTSGEEDDTKDTEENTEDTSDKEDNSQDSTPESEESSDSDEKDKDTDEEHENKPDKGSSAEEPEI